MLPVPGDCPSGAAAAARSRAVPASRPRMERIGLYRKSSLFSQKVFLVHARDHPPAHLLLISRIGRTEYSLERTLLPWHRNDEIERGNGGKCEAIGGHVRVAEHQKHPAEVEGMPHEVVGPLDLQLSSGAAAAADTGQLERVDGPHRLHDQPR